MIDVMNRGYAQQVRISIFSLDLMSRIQKSVATLRRPIFCVTGCAGLPNYVYITKKYLNFSTFKNYIAMVFRRKY
jgi:hypothetical protein